MFDHRELAERLGITLRWARRLYKANDPESLEGSDRRTHPPYHSSPRLPTTANGHRRASPIAGLGPLGQADSITRRK